MTALAGRQWDEVVGSAIVRDDLELARRLVAFEWPCDRRDAHKPHPRKPVAWIGDRFGDLDALVGRDGAGRLTREPCPGVAAHPATMIGRAS